MLRGTQSSTTTRADTLKNCPNPIHKIDNKYSKMWEANQQHIRKSTNAPAYCCLMQTAADSHGNLR